MTMTDQVLLSKYYFMKLIKLQTETRHALILNEVIKK